MSRLLTPEEHLKLHEDFFGEGSGGAEIDDTDLCLKVATAQDASTLKTVAEWLRSRWTPVGAQFHITAADLDRLAEGLPPQGMSE